MCGTLGRRALWACVLAIALVAPVFAMPAESDIRVEIARDATMHNHQLTLNITVSRAFSLYSGSYPQAVN